MKILNAKELKKELKKARKKGYIVLAFYENRKLVKIKTGGKCVIADMLCYLFNKNITKRTNYKMELLNIYNDYQTLKITTKFKNVIYDMVFYNIVVDNGYLDFFGILADLDHTGEEFWLKN